jgi:hypothetical protein
MTFTNNNKLLKSLIVSCCNELKKDKNKQIIIEHLINPIKDIAINGFYPYIMTHIIILGTIIIGLILIITLLIFNK